MINQIKSTFLYSTLLYLLFLTGCTDHRQKGAELFAEAEYTEALWHFQKILKMDPRDAMMHYHVARCYEEIGNFDLSILSFSKSIEHNFKFQEAYTGRARCNFKLKKYNLAIIDFSNALNLDKKDEESLFLRGLSYMKDSVYKEAQRDFIKLIELNPKHHKGRFNRAVNYAIQGNELFALSDFNYLIRNAQLLQHSHFNRGIIYQHKNLLSNAIHDYTTAINIGLINENIISRRAECFILIKQLSKACEDYKALEKFNPTVAELKRKEYCQGM